jgi:Trypsin-like peptidase domain
MREQGETMKSRIISLSLCVLLLTVSGLSSAAEDISAVARDILKKNQDSIVLVEVVVKVKYSRGAGKSQEREHRLEVNGTVIRKDGLTLLSNASIDPTANYKRYGLKADATNNSVKIILADGTEHEASVVLTDKDLDMAFVLPKEKVELVPVVLKKSVEPKLLDNMVSITRLDRKSNREPGVGLSRVMSIVRKPRVRFLASGSMFMSSPVFNPEGQVLGVALRRDGGGMVAVLPCEDILEVAGQIKPAKKTDENADDAAEDQGDDPFAVGGGGGA